MRFQLVCRSWEKFSEPRETTYTKYTELQREKEIFVDTVLDEIERTAYDARLGPIWLRFFARVIAPFRYPDHGFQMIAAYIGQMAPSGRITIAAALQCYRDYPSSDGPGTVSSTSRVKQTAYQKANCRRRRNWNNV